MEQLHSPFVKQPDPLYYANLFANERIVINQGGTSSGKSYCIMQVLVTIAMAAPNYVITVVSNTVPKLKEDTMRIMAELVANNPLVKRSVKDFNKSDRVYTFKNGTIIEFKSFENAEQAKGGKRHILYLNEATRVDYMLFFEANMRTYVRTYLDYNPSFRFWVHERIIENKTEYPSVKVLRSWHVHNSYLPQDIRDSIERIQDPELWKVYARGLTGRCSGAVYHFGVVDSVKMEDVSNVIWGCDFGYTNDPTALVKVYVMRPGMEWDYIVHECAYITGLSPAAIQEHATENGYKSGQVMYCDHDKEYVLQLRRLKVSAVMAEKKEIMPGILHVKQKRIAYTRSSKNIAEEEKKYRFIEVDGQPTNKPMDAFNHAMDALRYAIFSYRNRK